MKLAVPPLAFLLSAASWYQVTNGANVDITEHGECRNVANDHASGAALFVPTNTSTEWSTFYGNPPPGVAISACSGCTVTPGSQSFTTAGSSNFVVPCHNTLTVEVWGAGGGGVGWSDATRKNGTAGGTSSWDGTVIANGGGAAGSSAGVGGSASGGITNTTGGNGSGSGSNGRKGGNGANGGAGGAAKSCTGHGNGGTAPGGGGGGACNVYGRSSHYGNGAGGGGYSAITYAAGTYAVGASVPVTVGAGGAGGNGSDYDGGLGAVGRVTVTWN